MSDTIKLLNPDYDLTNLGDIELVAILEDRCITYDRCRHEISTATLNVWDDIVRVAREIVRRA